MSVSPIQRVSAILILISLIIWFFNTTLVRNQPPEPLVLSGEIYILSLDPEFDSDFFTDVLAMSKPAAEQNGQFYFREGFIILKGVPGDDTVTIRVSDMKKAWNEILASSALVISPPENRAGYTSALFKLPGGQKILLREK